VIAGNLGFFCLVSFLPFVFVVQFEFGDFEISVDFGDFGYFGYFGYFGDLVGDPLEFAEVLEASKV